MSEAAGVYYNGVHRRNVGILVVGVLLWVAAVDDVEDGAFVV